MMDDDNERLVLLYFFVRNIIILIRYNPCCVRPIIIYRGRRYTASTISAGTVFPTILFVYFLVFTAGTTGGCVEAFNVHRQYTGYAGFPQRRIHNGRHVSFSRIHPLQLLNNSPNSNSLEPTDGLDTNQATTDPDGKLLESSYNYRLARSKRLQGGHTAAQPYYHSILTKDEPPLDVSAGTWIAAAPLLSSTAKNNTATISETFNPSFKIPQEEGLPQTQNIANDSNQLNNRDLMRTFYHACKHRSRNNRNQHENELEEVEKLAVLRRFFQRVQYNTKAVNEIMLPNHSDLFVTCPLYIKSVEPGTVTRTDPIIKYLSYQRSLEERQKSSTTTTDSATQKQATTNTTTTISSKTSTGTNTVLLVLLYLFVLGIVVPYESCIQDMVPPEIIEILLDFHLISLRPYCSYDKTKSMPNMDTEKISCWDYSPQIVVPLVSIIPIDVATHPSNLTNTTNTQQAEPPRNDFTTESQESEVKQSVWITTDWHPRVLNTVTIPEPKPFQDLVDQQQTKKEEGDGTVMYIGPDSLALVQHWIMMYPSLDSKGVVKTEVDIGEKKSRQEQRFRPLFFLDLCTGSGVQLILNMIVTKLRQSNGCTSSGSVNSSSGNTSDVQAIVGVAVDTNVRALRFTRFNALLNQIPQEQIVLVHGDIVKGNGYIWEDHNLLPHDLKMNDDDGHYDSNSDIKSRTNSTRSNPVLLEQLLPDIVRSKRLEINAMKNNRTRYSRLEQTRYITKEIPYDEDLFDQITANPPFLPVPDPTFPSGVVSTNEANDATLGYKGLSVNGTNRRVTETTISQDLSTRDATIVDQQSRRYGLFSSGGPTGEVVLGAILSLANQLLADFGYLSIVSEFFFQQTEETEGDTIRSTTLTTESLNQQKTEIKYDRDQLLRRLFSYYCAVYQNDTSVSESLTISSPNCSSAKTTSLADVTSNLGQNSRGILLTNEYPISRSIYSRRRGSEDSNDEYGVWENHLQSQRITGCSPGLLYVQKLMQPMNQQTKEQQLDKTDPHDGGRKMRSSDRKWGHESPKITDEATISKEMNVPWTSVIVPRTTGGSIWTPTNTKAIQFTQAVARQCSMYPPP